MSNLAPSHAGSRTRHRNLGQIFAVPLALLTASLAGLIWGLLDDGWTDLAAALLLSAPLLAACAAWRGRG
ncbi:hypothetical protein [Erythrobacter sp. R86502]|uniref:hypothetical protein n=1 Tax=Erythrobacter sp. R86502 TaxID=3093846 RepID=UPI0036D3DCF5